MRSGLNQGLVKLACVVIALLTASCDKVWEVGQKLKAPEPVVPEVEEVVEAVDPQGAPADGGEGGMPLEMEPVDTGPVIDTDVQVSILGYHDFSERRGPTDMIIRPDRFREQMEVLKRNEIPVVSLSDYLAWKRGEKDLPDPSVVITIDDGWEGTYEHAFPILREYGYPFSVFIYKNYIGGGGRSLSYEEVREMVAQGAELGSHSVSHADMTRSRGKGEAEYEAWLRAELGDSMRFLREYFGSAVLPVFAYPYGKYNERVMDLAQEYGYELGLTVAPRKAAHSDPDMEVGRYIVHGDNDINFEYATTFRGGTTVADGDLLAKVDDEAGGDGEPLVTMWPRDGETVMTRTPRISVDLSKLSGVSAGGIAMTISGFGRVPCEYDAASGEVYYQIEQPLRSENCQVTVRVDRAGVRDAESVSWSFKIDRVALYLQEETVRAQPIESEPGL